MRPSATHNTVPMWIAVPMILLAVIAATLVVTSSALSAPAVSRTQDQSQPQVEAFWRIPNWLVRPVRNQTQYRCDKGLCVLPRGPLA